MKAVILIISALVLTNCTTFSADAQARSLLDRLEFGENETGYFRLSGQVDLNPIPFMTSTVNLDLCKSRGENIRC